MIGVSAKLPIFMILYWIPTFTAASTIYVGEDRTVVTFLLIKNINFNITSAVAVMLRYLLKNNKIKIIYTNNC